MSDDIETAEDYQEYYEAESQEGSSRYAEYTQGKAEAAELVVEGDAESTTAIIEAADERDEGVNTTAAAIAKGMRDAAGELAELGALDESEEDEADVGNDDEDSEDAGEQDPDESEEVERDTESISDAGGVEVDADEFA